MGFVERSFCGFGAVDDTLNPRTCALKLMQDVVRIRSRYAFDKLLQFSQKKTIQESHALHLQMTQKGRNLWRIQRTSTWTRW